MIFNVLFISVSNFAGDHRWSYLELRTTSIGSVTPVVKGNSH